MTVALAAKSDKTYVDDQLARKSNQLTTYTKTEVDAAFGLKANASDITVALATKATTVYVDGQLALTSQPTNNIHQNRGRYSIRAQR